MPLIINSTTNLNKLKFTSSGGDRWDEGKSGQPYITTAIPGADDTFLTQLDGQPQSKSGVDFLLRGGLDSVEASIRDVSRLTKLLFDTKSPNGFEFIAKQNVLSRNNVKTEATFGAGYAGGLLNQGAYAAVGTLAQAGLDPIATGATNLFGLNPFTDNTALSINQGNVTKQGSGGLNGYFGVVNAQNSDFYSAPTANRLVKIQNALTNGDTTIKTAGGNITVNGNLTTAATSTCKLDMGSNDLTLKGAITVGSTDGLDLSDANCDVTLSGSSSQSITHAGSTVSNIESNTTDYPIPDQSYVESTIAVSSSANASDLTSVTLNITHTFTGDLDITLYAPDGSSIDLSSDNVLKGEINYNYI